MSRTKRAALWLVLAIVLIATSVSIGWAARGYKRLPEILATLAGEERDFSSGVDARIRQKFPVGSGEDELIGYLDAEGFAPEWRRRNGQNSSRFTYDGMICSKTVRVTWAADDAGKLRNVGGQYAKRCISDLATQ